jgi:hypothetical protein
VLSAACGLQVQVSESERAALWPSAGSTRDPCKAVTPTAKTTAGVLRVRGRVRYVCRRPWKWTWTWTWWVFIAHGSLPSPCATLVVRPRRHLSLTSKRGRLTPKLCVRRACLEPAVTRQHPRGLPWSCHHHAGCYKVRRRCCQLNACALKHPVPAPSVADVHCARVLPHAGTGIILTRCCTLSHAAVNLHASREPYHTTPCRVQETRPAPLLNSVIGRTYRQRALALASRLPLADSLELRGQLPRPWIATLCLSSRLADGATRCLFRSSSRTPPPASSISASWAARARALTWHPV